MPKLNLASILDISVMKVVAISGRDSKKDFFDLYNIKKNIITVDKLIEGLTIKYGKNINYANTIRGLSYFEDAKQEVLSKTFVEYDWNEIKEFFISFQKEFQEKIESTLK